MDYFIWELHVAGVSEESAFLISKPEDRLKTLITIWYSLNEEDDTLGDKLIQLTVPFYCGII